MEYNKVKDSGQRQDFKTGSHRDTNEGKGSFELLPPYAIYRLARHFQNGARKYEKRNWEKGQPLSRYLDSALRHLFKHLGGMRDEDHLIAAAWNILCLVETERRIEREILPQELNDLPEIDVMGLE